MSIGPNLANSSLGLTNTTYCAYNNNMVSYATDTYGNMSMVQYYNASTPIYFAAIINGYSSINTSTISITRIA